MKILIQGGRVIDPASGFDRVCDVAVQDGQIAAIGDIASDFSADKVIHSFGHIVVPGLVELAARAEGGTLGSFFTQGYKRFGVAGTGDFE